MKHRVLLLLLLALTATDSHAQWANLRVLNPQNWTWGRATVEEALLSVQPHGAYLEYGLYLTISARGTTFFDADDLLEIEYLFQLPPGATFIDSWLWVGEEIVRAELRDVWSARQEYEDIVDRQRDPSILYKHEDHYELRIYPMRRDETRRVKLTYLLPASWRGSQLEAQLPTNLTSVSDHPVSLQVLAYPEAPNPRIIQSHGALVDVAFRPHDEVVEGGQLATLPERLPRGALSFAFDAPASGVLVQTSAETDSTGAGWYQLAFLPSALVQPERTDGLIVVLDYEARATSLSAAELRAETRAALGRHLAPGDRFVLLAEDGAPTAWRTASPEELDAAFATLGPLSGFSNLTTRLAEALAFAQRARTDGLGEARRVLLVSSADQHGAEASVEQILRDVEQQRPANLAFDALSFANETTKRYRIDG
ncbi:MAG: VIT domain-containing protein, partial [Bacteroidota bacterium]